MPFPNDVSARGNGDSVPPNSLAYRVAVSNVSQFKGDDADGMVYSHSSTKR